MSAPPPQPAGTVTLVFTDIEGSTRLLHELGTDAYRDALAAHRSAVREAFGQRGGYEVDYEGDAFFYAFASASDAVSAVTAAMRALASGPIRIRVGLHTGEPALDPPKYVGLDVHQAARIMSSAHGGQVVLSPTTVALLPDEVRFRALGRHRLKDLVEPVVLHQLVVEGLPDEFPPLKSLYRSTLPTPTTPFVGREAELQQVVQRVLDPNVRLLTLTGPGGTGKTRLALRAAASVAEHFPDGLYWVALAPIGVSEQAPATIAAALGIRDDAGDEPITAIRSAFADRQALLLIDNVEHLLPAIADDLAAVAEACPSVMLLVTSRERLQLPIESTWQVPVLERSDAVALFRERAAEAGAGVDDDDAVDELCRRLDDLPLALELASARTVVFTPREILARLGERLDLLEGGRGLDPRQQTLRATIDWSYRLLAADEQRVYRHLSLFPGGCSFAAAGDVAGASAATIQSLVERSLVRRRVDATGGSRYWMLETIREHAQERLAAAGEAEAGEAALCSWAQGLVGGIDQRWLERDQLTWLEALEVERSNLDHVLERCRAGGHHLQAAELLLGAEEWIEARGPYARYADLARAVETGDPSLDGRLALLRASLCTYLARFDDAAEAAERGIELGESSGDVPLVALVLARRSWIHQMTGELDTALTLAERALAAAEETGDEWVLAQAWSVMGNALDLSGRPTEGAELTSRSADRFEALGDVKNAVTARTNLAATLLGSVDPVDALPAVEKAYEAARQLGDSRYVAIGAGNVALALVATGNTTAARTAVTDAIEVGRVSEIGDMLGESLVTLALIAAVDGEDERATVLWGAASSALDGVGYVLGAEVTRFVEQHLEPLRSDPEFERRWQEGRALSLGEALAFGLDEVHAM